LRKVFPLLQTKVDVLQVFCDFRGLETTTSRTFFDKLGMFSGMQERIRSRYQPVSQ